jgi:hypothetical protein
MSLLMVLGQPQRQNALTARTYLEWALELATELKYQPGTTQHKLKNSLVRAIDRARDRAAELV